MAVNKTPQNSRLVIKVQTGVNGSGDPVYRQRSYNNAKSTASDADIYAVGQAIADLQQYPVGGIGRIDEANLVNE